MRYSSLNLTDVHVAPSIPQSDALVNVSILYIVQTTQIESTLTREIMPLPHAVVGLSTQSNRRQKQTKSRLCSRLHRVHVHDSD